MAHSKVYTQDTAPNQLLVKALAKKGYTNIVITWYSATTGRRGFILQCDQIPWVRLGYDIDMSLKAISLLIKIEL